jgi:hypothetical protein
MVTVRGYVPAAHAMTASQRDALASRASVEFGDVGEGLNIMPAHSPYPVEVTRNAGRQWSYVVMPSLPSLGLSSSAQIVGMMANGDLVGETVSHNNGDARWFILKPGAVRWTLIPHQSLQPPTPPPPSTAHGFNDWCQQERPARLLLFNPPRRVSYDGRSGLPEKGTSRAITIENRLVYCSTSDKPTQVVGLHRRE